MIAITYITIEKVFNGQWRYIGNGESVPQFDEKEIHHRICFSRDNGEYERCRLYVRENSADFLKAKIHVITDTNEAWNNLLN